MVMAILVFLRLATAACACSFLTPTEKSRLHCFTVDKCFFRRDLLSPTILVGRVINFHLTNEMSGLEGFRGWSIASPRWVHWNLNPSPLKPLLFPHKHAACDLGSPVVSVFLDALRSLHLEQKWCCCCFFLNIYPRPAWSKVKVGV